jgi:hypothetical protein
MSRLGYDAAGEGEDDVSRTGARWLPMQPQPYVNQPGSPRERLSDSYHPGAGRVGDRILIRGHLWLLGFEMASDGFWYDHEGRPAGLRHICDLLSQFGADFCALMERGCWPPSSGRLFEDGGDWEREYCKQISPTTAAREKS